MITRFLASQFSGYVAIAALVFITGAFFYVRHTGYQDCKNDQMIKYTTTAVKRNAIANNRPDTARFLDGLLRDSEW